MANEDDVRFRGSGKEYKDDRGGATLIPSAVLGIVKNNIDPTRSGRIQVALKRLGTTNVDDPGSWTTVRYLSPFFGNTPNTGNPQSYGDYVGNPNSYGFWATPPDINTEVICVFLNGDPNEGYYIGSIPQPGLMHMTPGIAASDSVIPNGGEAQSYGGATRLPVSEINNANSKQSNNPDLTNQPRPIHSYQAAIFNKQGLLRDPDRGPISSSSTRESPSRVFGMSTPGRPIYQGGYDDSTIGSAASNPNIPDKNFQVVGRIGGHTLVMDDGDITGKDQLMRFRTSAGHTILMSDTAQTLFVIHANGQSYIELGKEGTIDMYSTNSVNIRTQGDLNLHADRNITMHAAKNFTVNAENIQLESEKLTNFFTGTDFAQYVKGNYTDKVDGAMSFASAGVASFASAGTTHINGPSAVNLNTGSASLKPQSVKQVPKIKHTDTLYDAQKGFAAAPGKLESITSRAPAHAPWSDANKGVDAQTNLSAAANFPQAASPAVAKVNSAAPATPPNPTTPALVKTVPPTPAASPTMDKNTTAALASSMATNAATNASTAEATQTGAEKLPNKTAALGAYAMSPQQLEVSGHLKPGTSIAINKALSEGKSVEESIPPNAWTGKDGVTSLAAFTQNQNAQTGAAATILAKSQAALVEKGVITGKESPNQTGGLVVATASAGVGPVSEYVKTNAGLSSALSSVTSKLPPDVLNPNLGSVATLLAAGTSAAKLLDKAMSGAPPGVGESPEGVSKGLFDKIISGFKSLTAGKPQNLTAINAENKSEQQSADASSNQVTPAQAEAASAESKVTGIPFASPQVSNILSKAFNQVSEMAMNSAPGAAAIALYGIAKKTGNELKSVTPSGVDNLPGGGQSVATTVQNNVLPPTPGTGDIKGALSGISNGATGQLNTIGATLNGLKDKLGSNTNLAAFAGIGLSADDLGKLQGALNSVSAGGPTELKLPTLAEGTNDISGLLAQSKGLLGNDKIPPLNFGNIKPKELSPAETAEYNKLTAEKEKLSDKAYEIQKKYRDAQAKYGTGSPEAEAVWNELQTNNKQVEDINQKISNISSGGAGSLNPSSPAPVPMPTPQMPAKPIEMPTFPGSPTGPISI